MVLSKRLSLSPSFLFPCSHAFARDPTLLARCFYKAIIQEELGPIACFQVQNILQSQISDVRFLGSFFRMRAEPYTEPWRTRGDL